METPDGNERLSVVNQSREASPTRLGRLAQSDGYTASGDETIFGDVLAAVRGEFQRLAKISKVPSHEGLMRVKAMLGVISYCYIKGVFESDEIERQLWQDRTFLATFGHEIPTALKIRNFRQEHRAAILAIIESAVRRFEERKCGNNPASDTAHFKAEQLLNLANWMDQMNWDG